MHSFPTYITDYDYEKAKKTWAGAAKELFTVHES